MKKRIVAAAVLISIIMLLPLMARAESDMSRLNLERKVIGRALVEMQSDNWQALLQHYTDDIEYHDPIVTINGIDTMAQFLARLLGNSPDLITTVEDEICINDIYAATWTMEGKFSGAPYSAKGITIIKFRHKSTKVYYQRDYYSEGDIMISIPGLDQPIQAFRDYYRCAVDPTFQCPFGQSASDAISGEGMDSWKDCLLMNGQQHKMVGPRSNKSRINREREKIGRALIEIEATNWTSLLKYYTEDIEYNDPIVTIRGIEVMSQFLPRLFASSPDLITTVEDAICINGIYMATWTMAGQFNAVPYTAKGMSIVKFRPGEIQVYYSRDYYTEGDIMINIPGLDQPTQAFRDYYRCAVDPTFDCPFGPSMAASSPGLGVPEAELDLVPAAFKLLQNVPNPFNPSTTIHYNVPEEGGDVTLRIYDVSGRLVKTLVNGYEPSGARAVTWDGTNEQGQAMASGMYFYRMTVPGFTEMKKMALLR